MKKVTIKLGLMAILAISLNAENIDGTLSVDSNNALTQTQQTADTLSANLNDNLETAKNTEVAQTLPTTTSSYLEGPFVGIEANGIVGSNVRNSNGDIVSVSGMSYGLRFGAQNVDWRTMAILETFGTDGDEGSYLRGLLQLDYYFLGNDNLMVDSFALRPYVGVNAGILSIDTDNRSDQKSLTYGMQVGATTVITQNIDLDLGYKYNVSTDDNVESTHGLSVGLHYKY